MAGFEATTLTLEVIRLAQDLKDNFKAAKDCTKLFQSGITNMEKTLQFLNDSDIQLTPGDQERLTDWMKDCEDILKKLYAQTVPSFATHNVGLRDTITAVYHRLCYDPKEADRLVSRLLQCELQLNILYTSILLPKR